MVLLEVALAGMLSVSCPNTVDIAEYMSKMSPEYSSQNLKTHHLTISGNGKRFLIDYYDLGNNGLDKRDRLSIFEMPNGKIYNIYFSDKNLQDSDITREIRGLLD